MSDETEDSASGALVRVKYKSQDPQAFAVEHGGDVSAAGIFIKTKTPLALGKPLRLQLLIANGERVISGTGRVCFRREVAGSQPPGMGVEFVELDVASRRTVDAIVAARGDAASRFDDREGAEVLPSMSPSPRRSFAPPGLFSGAETRSAVSESASELTLPSAAAASPITGLFRSIAPSAAAMPAPVAMPTPSTPAPASERPSEPSGQPLERGRFSSPSSLPPAPAGSSAPPPRSSHPSAIQMSEPEPESEVAAAGASVVQSSLPPPLPSRRAPQAQSEPSPPPAAEMLGGLFDDLALADSESAASEPPAAEALDATAFAEDSDSDDEPAEKTFGSGRPTAMSLVGLEGRLTIPDAPSRGKSRIAFALLLVVLALVGFSAAFIIANGGKVPDPQRALKIIQDTLAGR